MGYIHYSNGHTRLPNIGLNALMLSTSLSYANRKQVAVIKEKEKPSFTRSSYFVLESNAGLGIHGLADQFNTHKNVYSISLLGA